jgi:hypothetical protein
MASVRDRGARARARVWPERPRVWSEGGGVVVERTPSRLERGRWRRSGENTLAFGARVVASSSREHSRIWSEGGMGLDCVTAWLRRRGEEMSPLRLAFRARGGGRGELASERDKK